jgi:hypothetical protein
MMATGGLASSAKGAVAAGAKKAVAAAVGEKAAAKVGEWTAKSMAGRAATWTGLKLTDAATRSAATFPRAMGAFEERRLPGGQVLTLNDEMTDGGPDGVQAARLMAGSEGQTLSEAARNTAISQMINFGSETMGGDINKVAVKVGAKAVGLLPKKVQADLRASFAGKLYQESQAAARLAKPRVAEAQGLPAVPGLRTWIGAAVRPRTGVLTQAGVHNYVTELAEEQLAMALNEGFGVDLTPEQLQDPLLQRLGRAFVPTTDDAVATMGVLAIPGLAHGVSGALDTRLKRYDAFKEANRMRDKSARGAGGLRRAAEPAGGGA